MRQSSFVSGWGKYMDVFGNATQYHKAVGRIANTRLTDDNEMIVIMMMMMMMMIVMMVRRHCSSGVLAMMYLLPASTRRRMVAGNAPPPNPQSDHHHHDCHDGQQHDHDSHKQVQLLAFSILSFPLMLVTKNPGPQCKDHYDNFDDHYVDEIISMCIYLLLAMLVLRQCQSSPLAMQ